MIPKLAITKLLTILAFYGFLGPPDVGVGAYYQPGIMQAVCERRVEQGWNPQLNCSWPCLISAIEQEHIGEWWLVYHPDCSYHLCQVVDCGMAHDLPVLRARNEVVEVSWDLAHT